MINDGLTIADYMQPNPADPTPQQTYDVLMGVSAQTWSWWVAWNDPYAMYGIDDDRKVPNGWAVTGRVSDPKGSGDEETIPFELTHTKLLTAVKEIALMTDVRVELVRECRQLLADPDSCDFDADSGDAVCQYALFGEFPFN